VTVDPPSSASKPRLNPFVFPSDTDLRFVLLVVSVLGSSLFIYNWLYYVFFSSEFLRAHRQCLASAAATYPDASVGAIADPSTVFALEKCIEPAEQAQFLWIGTGVALLLVVAVAIYWAIPGLKIRRNQFMLLTDERAPGMGPYLEQLCREVDLPRRPAFLVNPHNSSVSGVVFGRRGRRYVVLNAGLVISFYADRPTFRAVMLHELAHLRNADVDKTYFSVAIGTSFAVAALVPFAVYLIYALVRGKEEFGFVFGVSWRALALAALVYLTLMSILRARELYADVRASAWDGPSSALGRVLRTLSPSRAGRFGHVLKVHPDPVERRRVLTETDHLFRMGFWDAFGTGIAAMVAVSFLSLALSLAIPSQLENWAPMLTALFFAPLAVGVVGLGVWRGTFEALARNKTPRGMGRLGLALGLGVMVGQALSLDAPAIAGGTPIVFNLLLGVSLLIGLPCFLWWISIGARAWLERVTTRRSLRLVFSLGLILVGLLSTVLLGSLLWLFTTGSEALGVLAETPVSVLNAILRSPLILLVSLSLWAFPLAAGLWRERPTSDSTAQWTLLDPSPRPLTLQRGVRFRISRSLVIGTFGGLAFCTLLLIIHFGWNNVPEATRSTDQARVLFAVGQVALAILVQVITATVVAIQVRWLSGIHGLFAAFVAGCIMAVGILVLNLAFGGSITPSFAWIIFSLVVNGGALLALPVAMGASFLMSRFKYDLRSASEVSRERPGPAFDFQEESSNQMPRMSDTDRP
jgi:Zn-dependent protease with chaperone function